jgi:hypothetical protein
MHVDINFLVALQTTAEKYSILQNSPGFARDLNLYSFIQIGMKSIQTIVHLDDILNALLLLNTVATIMLQTNILHYLDLFGLCSNLH